MIVLDTNVLSELLRPQPDESVLSWVARQPARNLFSTAVTQAEILLGLEIMPPGAHQTELKRAVEQVFEIEFAGRILAFDTAATTAFAVISANRRKSGRPISQFDAQIAAIASSYGAAIATRNVADFEDTGTSVINPWQAP